MAVDVDDLSGARRRFQISWKLLNGIIGNHECKGVLLSTCYDLANNRAIHGFGITWMVIPIAPIFMLAIEVGQFSAVSRTDRLKRFAREQRSEEHTSELQSLAYLVCRLLLEKKKV